MRHRNLRGILTMIAAVSLLSLMDAGLKQLSAHYPPMQVCALRAAASWPFVAAWVISSTGARALLKVRWPMHLFRGALGVTALLTFVYGIRTLPLTTAYTLFFIAPILITALSALVLRERVDLKRWLAIALGFAGVLIALRPTGEGMFSFYGLAVLVAAAGYAISQITVRVLGRSDSTQSMVFWLLTLMALGSAALAAPHWIAIARGDWLLIAGVGLVGGLGQYAITEAFKHADASVIAPFEYTALAWGVGFDALVWGVLPDATTWLGAAVIVGSGLYLMRHEHVSAAEAQAQVQP